MYNKTTRSPGQSTDCSDCTLIVPTANFFYKIYQPLSFSQVVLAQDQITLLAYFLANQPILSGESLVKNDQIVEI